MDFDFSSVPIPAEDRRRPIWGRERCERCQGRGELYQYRHYQGGICFDCHGRGSHRVVIGKSVKTRKDIYEERCSLAAYEQIGELNPFAVLCFIPDAVDAQVAKVFG